MEKKKTMQTTMRIDPDLLHEARYYLNKNGLSVTQFVVQQLKQYVEGQKKAPPS